MKKVYLALVLVLMLLLFIPHVEAKGKAKVYMFTKEGCSACASAETYFNGLLSKEKGLFEVINMEVFDGKGEIEDEDAYNLMIKVLEHYKEDTEKLYTPTIVAGDYFNVGFSSSESDEIYDAIKKMNDEDYDDVVASLAKEEKIDLSKYSTEARNSNDAIVIIVIFVVLIGGLSGLIFLGKK